MKIAISQELAQGSQLLNEEGRSTENGWLTVFRLRSQLSAMRAEYERSLQNEHKTKDPKRLRQRLNYLAVEIQAAESHLARHSLYGQLYTSVTHVIQL